MVDQEQNRLAINPLKYLNNLPDFNGDNRDLQTFITLIDRVHPYLQTYDALSQQLFSDVIKSKFKGRAKQAIEINCHAVSWTDIKNVLQNNFGDRRSCDELFDELRGATFRTNTLQFYNEIKNRLHRLNNKLVVILGETEAARESANNNMRTALNIFKSKLPEPMKTILFCRNPTDLEQAMDILFQAGYAYNEGESQTTRHLENRSQNKQSTRNDQRNYRKQNYPNNGQHNYNRQTYRNPNYPIKQQAFNRPHSNRQNFGPQNRSHSPPQFNEPFQQQHSNQQIHPNFNSNRHNFRLNQQQNSFPEPMDVNQHETNSNRKTAQNFRQSASGGYHI